MKKILIFAMLVGASCAFAADSYMYWMVSDNATIVDGGGTSFGLQVNVLSSSTWSKEASKSGTLLNIVDSSGSKVSEPTATFGANADNFAFFTDLASVNSGYIFIELLADSEVVGYSDGMLYSGVATGALAGMGTPAALTTINSFTAIPEPNSGLLMLIGASVLALRRKKLQKKA